MAEDMLANCEQISALVDGELSAEQASLVVAMLADSAHARATWHAYHVVGDALRYADLAGYRSDHAFVSRVREGLSGSVDGRVSELPAAMPARPMAGPDQAALAARQPEARRRAANDSQGGWRFLASAMLVAVVVAVGWQLKGEDRAAAQLAQGGEHAAAPVEVPAAGVAAAKTASGASNEPPVMLRDARLDELLAAHKQFGGTSALQMPAGFLRNATFEQAGR